MLIECSTYAKLSSEKYKKSIDDNKKDFGFNENFDFSFNGFNENLDFGFHGFNENLGFGFNENLDFGFYENLE